MKDKYDLEIERLTENPTLIEESWKAADPLFQFIGDPAIIICCGCPSMIKNGFRAYNKFGELDKEFINEIRNSDIPAHVVDIEIKHLLEFARIQREADRRYNRNPG